MDPFKLLSRSTKLSKGGGKQKQQHVIPSTGQNAHPQLFPQRNTSSSRKRKRGQDTSENVHDGAKEVDFFGPADDKDGGQKRQESVAETAVSAGSLEREDMSTDDMSLPVDQRKKILKEHKLKVTWLNPAPQPKKARRDSSSGREETNKEKRLLFPNPLQSFNHLGSRYTFSKRMSENILEQGLVEPTEVQLGALPLLLDTPSTYMSESGFSTTSEKDDGIDLLTIAPTGSGKTLAFLIPLMHAIQRQKRNEGSGSRHTSTFILAPTRELAGQIVNEGKKLAANTGIKITQMRKGMQFGMDNDTTKEGESVVKADIVVSTPGVLQSATSDPNNGPVISQIRHLILDEADVLLDPLFREQTLEIWNSLPNLALRVSMWSATMGSNIEELAKNVIEERRSRLSAQYGSSIAKSPLVRLVVGLKDSAVPNVQHKLVYAATEQGKLMGLRQLLHPTSSESSTPLRPPLLIFTQTIERAIALHSELLYDIPAEAGGISRIAVLHSDLSDTARDKVMTDFRKGEVWVLITTDLLSRGVDFRGVNAVVNYDIPTSSAAYVHRIGRTGRAGREGGVAATLYSKEDIPYLKHVVNVVSMAQNQKGQDNGVQQWLLDALPTLSKNEKQNLKKRGIESRTNRGKQKDPKAARKARISTKAGFVRRTENNRKGAILGSQRRAQEDMDRDGGDESDFGGFD